MGSRVAVVTGGARGIGRATAERMLDDDYAVVIVDRDAAALRDAAADLGERGSLATVLADVADESAHERAADLASRRGTLGAWVNCAGFNAVGSVHELDADTVQRCLAVNLAGVIWGTAAAVRRMLTSGGGAIVNISSAQALVGLRGFAAYAAAKGGVVALTRQVAAEYADRQIRCNAIAPGFIATESPEEALSRALDPDALRSTWDALCPIGRYGQPADVAEAARYLTSDQAGFVTGHTLVVDGGATVLARGQ